MPQAAGERLDISGLPAGHQGGAGDADVVLGSSRRRTFAVNRLHFSAVHTYSSELAARRTSISPKPPIGASCSDFACAGSGRPRGSNGTPSSSNVITIESLSDSPYSHCAILARWDDRIIAFQADLRGVEILPASTMVCKYQGKVDWWPLKAEWRRDGALDDRLLLDTALTLLGIKYAYWTLIELGVRILLGRALNPTEAHATPDSLFAPLSAAVLVYACWPSNKRRFDRAAQSILDDEDKPWR